MKLDFRIFVRHFVNYDIIQRGWNRIRIQFRTERLTLRPVAIIPLVHYYLDNRDPQRFFDDYQHCRFNEAENEIIFPAFRVEFFEQIVYFSYEVYLAAELRDIQLFDIVACISLDFTHFPREIPKRAPERYERVFQHEICFKHVILPSIQPYVEDFAEGHFARLEMVFMWRVHEFGSQAVPNRQLILKHLQEMLFVRLYGDTFENALRQVKNMKNIGILLRQFVVQQISDAVYHYIVVPEGVSEEQRNADGSRDGACSTAPSDDKKNKHSRKDKSKPKDDHRPESKPEPGSGVNRKSSSELSSEAKDAAALKTLLAQSFELQTEEHDVLVQREPVQVFFSDEDDGVDIYGDDAEMGADSGPGPLFNDSLGDPEGALIESIISEERAGTKRRTGFRRDKQTRSDAECNALDVTDAAGSEAQSARRGQCSDRAQRSKHVEHAKRAEHDASEDADGSNYDNLDALPANDEELTQDLDAQCWKQGGAPDSKSADGAESTPPLVQRCSVHAPQHQQFAELCDAAYQLKRQRCAVCDHMPHGAPYLRELPPVRLDLDQYLRRCRFSQELEQIVREFRTEEVAEAGQEVEAEAPAKSSKRAFGPAASSDNKSPAAAPRHGKGQDHKIAGRHVVFFVHGFQGNCNDLRFFRNVFLKFKALENAEKTTVAVLCRTFYKNAGQDMSVYGLGYHLALEVTQSLAANYITPGQPFSISFVGFSLGNLVVSACVQSDHFRPYLPHLRAFVSINGPHLGARSERPLVNFGAAFLRCFSSQRCVSELNNCQLVDIQRYADRYRFLRRVKQHEKTLQSAELRALTLLAAGSLNTLFDEFLLIGSANDGYVRADSATCYISAAAGLNQNEEERNDGDSQEAQLLGTIAGTHNRRLILTTNKHNAYHGKQIDAQTGRDVHITPLISHASTELLVCACYDVL